MNIAIIKITNCTQCSNHIVVRDPDPYDSFCSDDVAVLCKAMPNDDDKKYWALNIPFEHKVITCSCRPYKTEEECTIPDWCPLLSKII